MFSNKVSVLFSINFKLSYRFLTLQDLTQEDFLVPNGQLGTAVTVDR